MTTEEIDQYKRHARVGDRIAYGFNFPDIWYVQSVEERGVVVSLREKAADHKHLIDFGRLINPRYKIAHKEP